jgi:hypothetical protein
MEYMGLGALLALWRYFFDIDWDFRVRRGSAVRLAIEPEAQQVERWLASSGSPHEASKEAKLKMMLV